MEKQAEEGKEEEENNDAFEHFLHPLKGRE